MKIAITAETTIDLPKEILEEYEIRTTPFGIDFGGSLKDDRFGISSEIFEYVESSKQLPKTSAIPPEQYREFFEEIKKDYDAIIHFSISSLMSSAYNNAKLISSEMENVYVVDSMNLSTGIALLAMYASTLNKSGKSYEDIISAVEERKHKIRSSFVVEKLNYLYKGGRCSALTLLGANVLKIKPQIVVENGRMSVGKKYVGAMNKIINKYCDDLMSQYPNVDLESVFITHSSPMPDIQKSLKSKLQDRGFVNVYDTLAGGTISSHCGPNCIGILFFEK